MSRFTPQFIGLRYILSKRSNGFMSFVSVFATGGMALGVFALIVVLSVMNGFDRELKERILRAVPHAFVTEVGGLERWRDFADKHVGRDGLQAASPFVGGHVLIANGTTIKGVQLRGIDPSAEASVSPIGDFLIRGKMQDLTAGEFGIVLGSYLSYSLGAHPGDKVVVTLPEVSTTFAGVFPRSRQFTVVGVFEVGAELDQQLALIELSDAQKLFRRGLAVDGLRLRYTDLYHALAAASRLRATLEPGQKSSDLADGNNTEQAAALNVSPKYTVTDWSQTQGSLFRAVKLEKVVTGMLLGIIIAVAAFNIITSLIMMVTEKRSNIAVLRTMGMARMQVMQIFITQGFVTALMGIVIGLVAGIPTAIYLPEIVAYLENLVGVKVFDPSVYFVARLPSLWLWSDTVIVCAFAVVSSILATLYPAYRASLIEPAEAMRYNT